MVGLLGCRVSYLTRSLLSINSFHEGSQHPGSPSVDHYPLCENAHDITNVTTGIQTNNPTCVNAKNIDANHTDLMFSPKGLHLCNLNVQRILPKIDELRIIMANDRCPDIMGLCETFLGPNITDSQVAVDGFEFIRKDMMDTQNRLGGGLILYFRESLKVRRRPEYEFSKIETIWAEIELPNSKPFIVCSVYRPPNAHSEWIDLFEEELSIAQVTGLELILMGDLNIDLTPCTNNKWSNLIQLFDLSQLVREPTLVTESSATLIDHVYSSCPENITSCFVSKLSASDHFPICS